MNTIYYYYYYISLFILYISIYKRFVYHYDRSHYFLNSILLLFIHFIFILLSVAGNARGIYELLQRN